MNALTLDTETTGVSVSDDRLVQAFLGLMTMDGEFDRQQEWLVDPGVLIPQGASDVHGYVNRPLNYRPNSTPIQAIEQIHAIIQAECTEGGAPIIAFNASFDLSLLEFERRRHAPHVAPIDYASTFVIDPYVLWKKLDRYRKGKRTLAEAAKAFGVEVDETLTHGAAYDCLLAGRVALKMFQRDELRGMPLDVIHEAQIFWKRDQNASLRAHFAKSGNDSIVADGWPLLDGALS